MRQQPQGSRKKQPSNQAVLLLQTQLKDAYLQVTAMMNLKRNLAKQTFTLEAFHPEQLMMI